MNKKLILLASLALGLAATLSQEAFGFWRRGDRGGRCCGDRGPRRGRCCDRGPRCCNGSNWFRLYRGYDFYRRGNCCDTGCNGGSYGRGYYGNGYGRGWSYGRDGGCCEGDGRYFETAPSCGTVYEGVE